MGTCTEISFGLFDVTAKPDSTPTCTDKQAFVDMDQLKLDAVIAPPAATLEPGFWILDGTYEPFPDHPELNNWGLWSESMSGPSGAFAVPPVLNIAFAANHTSKGLFLEFCPYGNNYCNSINIKWYQGATLLSDKNFAPDSWRYMCENIVENYNKVVLTFNSTSVPYRYLKLQKIDYGEPRIFDGDEVIDASILEEMDPISAEISINTLNFKLHSTDAEFSILNPQGLYALLQQRQPLTVTEVVDSVRKPMGIFFLDEWKNESENSFEMGAVDAIGVMDGTTYRGGLYSGIMAGVLLADIIENAGFGHNVDSSYSAVPIYGWLPICSHREALQQVAFAIGALVDTSRTGSIKVYPAPVAASGTITKDQKLMGGSVKLRALVTGIEVTEHTFVASGVAVELFNGALAAGTSEIVFSEIAYDLTITGATITASNCNCATVNVAAAGTVVLSGKKYTDVTRTIGKYMASLPAGEKRNVLTVSDATLVSSANSATVAERIYNYYQKRIEQSFPIKLGSEQVGKIVNVETLYNTTKAGTIESLETDLTGGFLSKVVVVGE